MVRHALRRGAAALGVFASLFVLLLAGSASRASWVGVGGALREDTRSIAFGRVNAQTLWAFSGHKHFGVFRCSSSDNGQTWGSWQQTSLDEFTVYSVSTEGQAVVNTVVTGANYATTPLVLAGTSAGTILRSTDHGATWTASTGLPAGGGVMEMAVHPNGNILAAVSGGGVYRSVDGGVSFTQLAPPVGTGLFLDLTLHPGYGTNGMFFATTQASGSVSGGIYRWSGTAWVDLSAGLPGWGTQQFNFSSVAVAPDLSYLWAGDMKGQGLFGSQDGGATWQQGCLACDSVLDLRVAPDFSAANKHLMIGTGFGWYESISGACQHRMPQGLAITSVVFDPNWSTANPVLWLATSDGIRKFGANEFPAPPDSAGDLSLFDISFLAPSPASATDNRVYAASRQFGVFLSQDGGNSFTQFMPSLSAASSGTNMSSDVSALALHPNFNGTTAGCGGNSSTVFMATRGAGVYRSDAGGARWIPMNAGLGGLRVSKLVHTPLVPADGNFPLFAGRDDAAQVYRYDTNLSQWNGPLTIPAGAKITALALPPNHDGSVGKQEVYAGTDQGLFKSADRGATWTQEPLPPPLGSSFEVDAIAFHPGYNGTVLQEMFVVRKGSGVLRKAFQPGPGWTWVYSNGSPALPNLSVTSLAISPNYATDHALVAGVYDPLQRTAGGVYLSLNSGAGWNAFAQPPSAPQIIALAYVAKSGGGARLMAGTLKRRAFYNDAPNDTAGAPWFASTGFETVRGEVRTVAMSPVPTNTGCAPLQPTADGSDVFLGGTGGVFWSNDAGQTFRPINEGLAGLNSCIPEVNALFVFRNSRHQTVAAPGGDAAGAEPTPMLLAGTTGQGIWYRYATKDILTGAWDWTDGVWVQSDLATGTVNRFTRERTLVPLVVRAATDAGLFSSYEADPTGTVGQNWRASNLGGQVLDIRLGQTTVPLRPADPKAPSGSVSWGTVSNSGVRRGTDSGPFAGFPMPEAIVWEVRNGTGAGALADASYARSVLQLSDGTVLCGSNSSGSGVWRTSDEGLDFWESSSDGLEATSKDVRDFLQASNGDVLCAVNGSASNGGIFLSADTGKHWVSISDGFSAVQQTLSSVVANSDNPPTYYCGSYTAGSYASTITPLAAPTATMLDVSTGPSTGGTTVTLTGTGFLCACPTGYTCPGGTQAKVSFGGVDGVTTSCSSTSLTVTTPAHAAGAASVVVRNPDTRTGALAGSFTFTSASTVTITVSRNGSNQVVVSWTGGGTPTKIFRSTSPTFTTFVSSAAASNPYTYADVSGTDGHVYYYTVE